MDIVKKARIVVYSIFSGVTIAGALIIYLFAPPPRNAAWMVYFIAIAILWASATANVKRRSPRQKVALFLGPIVLGSGGSLGLLLGHATIGLLTGALIYIAGIVYAGRDLSKKCNSKADGDS
jgi:drug/metabolite transporter (DMT)-like permease